jgi:sigma-B regulation protein RsbU (phosphoserine phosphatase)
MLELQQGRFALTLGDVSGKSVAAAVLMASIHTLLRSFLMRSWVSLSDVITELNKAVYANSTPERYSTLFCGVLTADSGSLAFVNAGHVPPILIRASDGRIERPAENDLPVGLLPLAKFQQHELILEPGDLLIALSDGVMEAENDAHESPDPAVIDSVLFNVRHKPVRDIGVALIEAVDRFCSGAEQFDDMTVVVLRVNGNPQARAS